MYSFKPYVLNDQRYTLSVAITRIPKLIMNPMNLGSLLVELETEEGETEEKIGIKGVSVSVQYR